MLLHAEVFIVLIQGNQIIYIFVNRNLTYLGNDLYIQLHAGNFNSLLDNIKQSSLLQSLKLQFVNILISCIKFANNVCNIICFVIY